MKSFKQFFEQNKIVPMRPFRTERDLNKKPTGKVKKMRQDVMPEFDDPLM